MFDLEMNIRSWIDHLRAQGNFKETDILELEDHMRNEIEDLVKTGLAQDEAFLISVKRLGEANMISNEFAKVNTEDLWKNLFTEQADPAVKNKNRRTIALVIIFSLLSGTLTKMPQLLGIKGYNSIFELAYFKNLSLFVLPFIALFFIIKRKSGWKKAAVILGIFAVSAILINIYPSYSPENTRILTCIHLPIFLWLITGSAYIGTEWRKTRGRMDFIRFTGESIIYGTLIFCGLMVLMGFTGAIFSAIQIDAGWFIQEYLIIYGLCAAAIVTVYLVEAKKSIVENFAPILAKIFSPLFLITMTAFIAAMIVTGKSPFVEREYLIGFDLMLVLVLGLVLYVISARNMHEKNKLYDYMNLALIIAALIIDSIALYAILFRLSAYGATPNKLAALGENIALFINLGGLAWLYICYFIKKIDFNILEKWQTFYLNIYAVWMAVVAFLFPVIFGFH